MSGDQETENIPETSSSPELVANVDDDDVVGAHSESILHQESSSREANYDSNNSNEDGVMVNTDNNGSGGDSDGVVVSEDAGREDMFLDAPEDLGADGRESSTGFTEAQGSTDGDEDSGRVHQTRFRGLDNEMQNDYMVDEMERLRTMLDKTINEKESIIRDHKDEMEMAAKGMANLRDQMREFTNKQLLLHESQSGSQIHFHADGEQAPLHELIHECSMFLRSFMEEAQNLNAKSSEVAVTREVVSSYLTSVQNESVEVQFQKDQYMEDATNRILSSFASLVYVGDLLDTSITGKIAHIEKSVYASIENYNWFLYQSDQLRQCLAEVRPDLAEQTDYGVIFASANEELLGLRKKESDFAEKLGLLEGENSELKELLQKHKAISETANVELERLKTELEQEKHRYSNTKEKLSLAVTKGKALVQQRDTLKQALADKTSALEAAELIKEELVKSQISSASFQEVIVQKDLIFEKLEDILYQSGVPEGLNGKDVTEKIMWLVDERNALKDVSLKFHQLADALLSIDLPENFSFSDLESRLGWLTNSFDEAKAEIAVLQDEIYRSTEALNEARAEIGALQEENSRIRETAYSGVEQLTTSLSTNLMEKDCIRMELDDLSHKFEAAVQREHQASLEKEQMLNFLLEASGVTMADRLPSETAVLLEQCLVTLKERSSLANESSEVSGEIIQKWQSLLYLKEQDLVLNEQLFEEETQKMKMEMDMLQSDLMKASEEIVTLKEENENLKRNLERTEDKSALIREKLSMAVKKGKGLVQEREGLKHLIDEKTSEIEKLKLELLQNESVITDCKAEISRLSDLVEGIAKMEGDLLELKDQREQLEMDLSESNGFIHAVREAIDRFALPADSKIEDPLEKLKWLAGYLSECEDAKAQAHQQLEDSTLEVETLTTKVSEAHSSIRSLEDALAVAEEKISQLNEEKSEFEVAHTSVQQQLQRAMQEASLFAEADAVKKSLEHAIAAAESNMSRLGKEKEEAESNRAASEAELDKARSEIAAKIDELSKATTTIKSLEDNISHLETRISIMNDESNEAQIDRANLENELKELKEEAKSWDRKLQDAHLSMASLNDALKKAENDITELTNDKKAAEQEISTLTAKLNACLEELAGTHGSLESRSLKLFDHLQGLELLAEDESTVFSLRRCCDSNYETLKEMEGLFRNLRVQIAEMGPEDHPILEEPSALTKLLSTNLDDVLGADIIISHGDGTESDDISLYVKKIVESFQMRKKTVAEKVNGLLSFLNECNMSIAQEIMSISRWVTPLAQKMNSLDEKLMNLELNYQESEIKTTALEDDVSVLLSACKEATQLLELEVEKRMPVVKLIPEFEVENNQKYKESKHMSALNKLLLVCQKVSSVCEQYENLRNSLLSKTEELQSKLSEQNAVASKATEERDLYSNKVCELETNLTTLQNSSSELRLKLEKYQDIEAHLRVKDTEISSLQSNLKIKERETGEALLWASHLKSLLENANRIQVSAEDIQAKHMEPHDSNEISKLVYIIDKFPEMQSQIESLSLEKEKLQTDLSAQLREAEHLKEQIQESIGHEKELAKVRSQVVDTEAGLNSIIQMFATRGIAGYQKFANSDELVQVLEGLVISVIEESETLKSKANELELEVAKSIHTEQELKKLQGKILDLEGGIQKIIKILKNDTSGDQKPVASGDLVQVLEKLATTVIFECESLKSEVHEQDSEVGKGSNKKELTELKYELLDLEAGMNRIVQKLRRDATVDHKSVATRDILQLLETMVMALVMESENSKSRVHELDAKLLGSQKAVDELSLKNKLLEDALQSRAGPPDSVQERSIFEAPSQPPTSEISEIEDVGSVSKPTISPVPSSTHVRTMRKGSSDHIAVNIDTETSRLIDNEEPVDDKGHVFKSLNTSGIVPKQGKMIADRIDGIWVSGGRLLMSRPRARLGLIAYWLLLHIWLLGTIL